MSGTQDVVIAGGVEVMSLCPIGSSVQDGMANGHGFPYDGEGMQAKFPGVMFSQFAGGPSFILLNMSIIFASDFLEGKISLW
tara:strand:- start:346 stop:591 length:246 start_codon:yes stop_codon:yes gene_type:complete